MNLVGTIREIPLIPIANFLVIQEEELNTSIIKDQSDIRKAVRNWVEEQNCQKILLTTPSVLVGYRLRVYRAEGTTQWYTAVIKSYNATSRVRRSFYTIAFYAPP